MNGGERGQLIRIKKSGDSSGKGSLGMVNGEKEKDGVKVEQVEILPGFEDVDCVGLMGGGMELKG